MLQVLTKDLEERALELAIQGVSLGRIQEQLNISRLAFLRHRKESPIFSQIFSEVREEGLEYLADSLLDVVDEYADVMKARVQSDNIKWLLGKRKPHVYGDKLQLDVNQNVNINVALSEARSRSLHKHTYTTLPENTPQLRDVSNSSLVGLISTASESPGQPEKAGSSAASECPNFSTQCTATAPASTEPTECTADVLQSSGGPLAAEFFPYLKPVDDIFG